MQTKKTHIEVILPIFNEVQNIPPLLHRLDLVARQLKNTATLSYLFINDGSRDGSTELLNELHSKRNDVRLIHLLHNFGHAAAITCGIENFKGDVAILMDADLQDPPEAIPDMVEAWVQGSNTVVAERTSRAEKTRFLFQGFYFLLHKIAPSLPPINFGTHCLLDASVVQRVRSLKEKNRYFPGLVGFSSGPIHSISVDRLKRNSGKSRVGMRGLIQLAVTAFLSFSNTPVRLVSMIGLVASVSALLAGSVIVFIKVFTTQAIPGWASTMSAIAFGNGIQLLCLGIIGEYIARIYDEVKQRPLYMIDKILEPSAEKAIPLTQFRENIATTN